MLDIVPLYHRFINLSLRSCDWKSQPDAVAVPKACRAKLAPCKAPKIVRYLDPSPRNTADKLVNRDLGDRLDASGCWH